MFYFPQKDSLHYVRIIPYVFQYPVLLLPIRCSKPLFFNFSIYSFITSRLIPNISANSLRVPLGFCLISVNKSFSNPLIGGVIGGVIRGVTLIMDKFLRLMEGNKFILVSLFKLNFYFPIPSCSAHTFYKSFLFQAIQLFQYGRMTNIQLF